MLSTPLKPTARPVTLRDRLNGHLQIRRPLRSPGLIAYPRHWQVPAATEKAAYDAMVAAGTPAGFEYLGFPWATLIDGLRGDAGMVPELLMALRTICEARPIGDRRATVAQHISALEFMELYAQGGVTDLFWSHATHERVEAAGIRIHPFPLFPAQTAGELPPPEPARYRRHLANFIGAYNARIYRTDVRQHIFEDEGTSDDLLIVKRDAWHFDRAVYAQQIQGVTPPQALLEAERRQAGEYVDAIRGSWFTLCPSGSGPNSIRIFESLCLGSIPIILTRDLRLAGPAELWRRAAIVEADSRQGYEAAKQAARAMRIEQRLDMLRAGAQLCRHVLPAAFADLIVRTMADADPALQRAPDQSKSEPPGA